jgi:hypothetical protein
MSEQEGHTNLVKGKTLQIEDMLLESSNVPTLIEKVRFKTGIGDVTWKPYKKETMLIAADGFNIKRQRDRGLYIIELPQIIYQIRDNLMKSKSVTVKTDYQEWYKTPEQVFYFLNEEQIKGMKIETPTKQETKRGETNDKQL